jgi:hypothetical protein
VGAVFVIWAVNWLADQILEGGGRRGRPARLSWTKSGS